MGMHANSETENSYVKTVSCMCFMELKIFVSLQQNRIYLRLRVLK